MTQSICIVGGGVAGLGAAWALHHHPDKYDFQIWEKNDRLGGNAMTVDIPQDGGKPPVPVDISVTAFIPSVYQHYVELMERFGIDHVPTRFSYTVHYGDGVYGGLFTQGMYCAAYFEARDTQKVIEAGLGCIPPESLYAKCIRDVLAGHKEIGRAHV